MSSMLRVALGSLAAFGLLFAVAFAQPELPPVQIPPDVQDQIPPQPADGGPIPGLEPKEVLTRGPVHEAFAQPADTRVEAAVTVKQQPPEPLPEIAPNVRPEDENAEWIPGYWAFDGDNNQFIWVTGVYRVPPPNRTFVPGHWANTPEGWTWIPGFWAPRAEQEAYYLPEPPAPKEEEPQVAGPEDAFYVPGNWTYTETQYVWRPGYYARYRLDRVWVPARYLGTPSGYLFVNGYWDYPLEHRGLLFAPVAFQRAYWQNPRWTYQPRHVVALPLLLDSLFARPAAGHFYFGDYYGANYARMGYRPWFDRRQDPLFAYYRYENRANPNWATGVRQTFQDRTAGRGFIPPRNLAEQTKIINQITTVNNNTNVKNVNINKIRVVETVDQSVTTNNVKVTKVDAGQAKLQAQRIRQFREMQTLRTETEKPAIAPKANEPNARPQVLKIINTATATGGTGTGTGGTGTGGKDPGGNVGKGPKTVKPMPVDPKIIDPKVVDPIPKVDPFPKKQPKQVDPTPDPLPKKEFPKQVDPAPVPKKELPKQIDPMPQPKKEFPKQIDPQPKFEVPKKEFPKQVDPTPKVNPMPKKEFPKFVDPVPQPKVNPQPAPQPQPMPQPKVQPQPVPQPMPQPVPQPQPKVQPQPVPQPQPQPKRFDPPPVREAPKAQPMPQPAPQPKAQPAPVREAPKASPKADPPARKNKGDGGRATLNVPQPRQAFVATPAPQVEARQQRVAPSVGNAAKGRRR